MQSEICPEHFIGNVWFAFRLAMPCLATLYQISRLGPSKRVVPFWKMRGNTPHPLVAACGSLQFDD
jgi:hypothetical protein